jgi:hypothetical protein
VSDWDRFVKRAADRFERGVRLHVVQELRCAAVSPTSGRRCTREWKHRGEHERRRRSGSVIELWPRAADDDQAPATATYAELLDHLDDLIGLARAYGIGRIVAVLTRARAELQYGPPGQPKRKRGTRPTLLR